MSLSPVLSVTLRPATVGDAQMLAEWDRQPHVIACSSDDPEAEIAFGGIDWAEEIAGSAWDSHYLIAEVAGRPVGVMQICDPHTESTHYWGEIEPNLRALDIWIGPPEWLGRGVGTRMMRQVIGRCFAEPDVTAIVIDPLASNTAAHRFYGRLGFAVVGQRMFDADHSLVMRLEKADWRETSVDDSLVIPDAAQRRSGTAEVERAPGPAKEPGRTQGAADLANPSPGSTLAGRPGASGPTSVRPGSSLRSGRDDKARRSPWSKA